MNKLVAVILSGGSGTRLWPLSRASLPKQFLTLTSERTMIQEAALCACEVGAGPPLVLSNQEHRFQLAQQLQDIDVKPRAIVLEPYVRNTAPAAIVGALMVAAAEPKTILLIMPSDHVIADRAAFQVELKHAVQAAQTGKLVTFGIKPNQPATGYGYIHKGRPLHGVDGAYEVLQFVEKPNMDAARRYLAEGNYYWNSGMFVFLAESFLAEAKQLAPAAVAAAQGALDSGQRDHDFIRLDAATYGKAPNISLDYAIMEKTKRAAVVPASFGWADVGSWAAVHELSQQDPKGNTLLGDVAIHDVENSYLRAEHSLLAAIGIRNLFVIATRDALLIGDKTRAQDIRVLVDQLNTQGRSECMNHARVQRPWGTYEVISMGEGFQVKHIVVMPGGRLSLQMHHKRAEHWTVVRGMAQVTCGDKVFTLGESQSTFIPLGAKHRLENLGDSEVHLIEVQTGSYLGEDDIVRFDDAYGRA